MVFVWSQLTKGDPNYTLVQVSVNDLIFVVGFAPIATFLLGVTEIAVPWGIMILSAVLCIVIPLIAGTLKRRELIRAAPDCGTLRVDRHLEFLRTGGRCRHRLLRPELRRGSGYGGTRSG